MAEAVGLVLGVGGLAGLFGATVDAFDHIKAAKSYSRDFEILSTMYDMRRATLLQWGTAVGLADGVESKTLSKWSNSDLRPLVERALSCIQMILNDTEELQERYGLRQVKIALEDQYDSSLLGTSLSRQRLRDFKSSYNRFRTSIRDRQKNTSVVRKTQWAIFDRGEFHQLLQDLGVLIDDLYKLVPVSLAEQARLIEEDASTLPNDIEHIKLIEEAREALAEDPAAEHPEDLFKVPYSFPMPEEVHAASSKAGTAPPSVSFMEAATLRPPAVKSLAFASVASSNASWATALSHRTSMIEARSPVKTKTLISDTHAVLSVGICPSVQRMLQDHLEIEAVFMKTLPFEPYDTANVAFCCGGSDCGYNLPAAFRAGASAREPNTGKAYYQAYMRHRIREVFAYRASYLAKSHMPRRTNCPDLSEYRCLICKLLRPDSLDDRLFIGVAALLSHVASHAGQTLSGNTLSGPMTFHGSGFSKSADKFDIDFLGVGIHPSILESGHDSASQNELEDAESTQFELAQPVGQSVRNWGARRREADIKNEREMEAIRIERGEPMLLPHQQAYSEWELDHCSIWRPGKVRDVLKERSKNPEINTTNLQKVNNRLDRALERLFQSQIGDDERSQVAMSDEIARRSGQHLLDGRALVPLNEQDWSALFGRTLRRKRQDL